MRGAAGRSRKRGSTVPITMYMRITAGKVRPGCWDAFETAYRERIEGRMDHGLRARWLARSTTDVDAFFTISLWESVADLEAYERSDAVRREVLKYIAPHLIGVSTAHHCAVRYDLPLTASQLRALFLPSNVVASGVSVREAEP
jgi:heme-degrading monooxygenase HmoA